jgi:hypothetical protein
MTRDVRVAGGRIVGAVAAIALLAAACGSPSPAPAAAKRPASRSALQLTALPLGDGKISTSPRAGYVYACQTAFGRGGGRGPGRGGSAPWISGTSWDLTAKPTVHGSVAWPTARVTIARRGDDRVVTANNLPLHPTGVFPIQRPDPAFRFDGNPNSILEQRILLTLPADPAAAETPSCVPQGMIGFTVIGAALFNALDAGGRDAAAHEVQDACSGHPQQEGQYRYHSWSNCLADAAGAAGRHSDLVAYALDGYGIYGLHGENGAELTDADLDACHGHTHVIMWDGKTVVMYHYHMTREYPYSVGCFHGQR